MSKIHILTRVVLIFAAVFIIAFAGFIIYWEAAPPQSTCSSCHEIESTAAMLTQSGHRDLNCKECHGTAFSNGFHSMAEKAMMIVNHFSGYGTKDVHLNETQIVEMLENCKRCHGIEYAKWMSGGHSATYSAIFLNKRHNSVIQPNADCLRCHGMFYEGSIWDLVTPVSIKGPWNMVNPGQGSMPVIPCLTCHEIHRKGSVSVRADYSSPRDIFYRSFTQFPIALYYNRYEKIHREPADLPALTLWGRGEEG